MDFKTRVDSLKTIRNDIKQNRLILDDSRSKFGLDKLKPLIRVEKISQVRGCPHHAVKDDLHFSVKAVPTRSDFPSENHPNMIEYIFLKEFNDNLVFKGISPHITGYLGAKRVKTDCRGLKHLTFKALEMERVIKSKILLIISEYIDGGSLDEYNDTNSLSVREWKMLIFQVIYTLYALQKRYKFMHNDLHFGNILVSTGHSKDEISEYIVFDK